MISTFITNKKIPRVTSVMGSVRITRIGFTMAFKNASTSAKINAVVKDSICT
jgi:hypothetical protein